MQKTELIELTTSEMISIDGGNIFRTLGEVAGFIIGTAVSFVAGLIDGLTGNEKR
jgi:hypothetical protein